MRLFLASEAKNPVSFPKLEEFAGGFKDKKLVYIPTAANGQGWKSWKDGGSWALVQTLGADLKLLVLEDYWDWNGGLADELDGADIIWFAGGQPGYLMYWIRRTKLDQKLKKALENGALYVGSSAGSMIAANSLEVSEWYVNEHEPGAGFIPGLGLIDFEIYPHYKDELLPQIKEKFKGKKLYLLKDGEAIIVEDNNVVVFGEERTVD